MNTDAAAIGLPNLAAYAPLQGSRPGPRGAARTSGSALGALPPLEQLGMEGAAFIEELAATLAKGKRSGGRAGMADLAGAESSLDYFLGESAGGVRRMLASLRQQLPSLGINALTQMEALTRLAIGASGGGLWEHDWEEFTQDEGTDCGAAIFNLLRHCQRAPRLSSENRALYQKVTQSKTAEELFRVLIQAIGQGADRERCVRSLIVALGLTLRYDRDRRNDAHMFSVVSELRRLLLFLGVSERCEAMSGSVQDVVSLSGDQIMSEVISTASEAWVISVKLIWRMGMLGASDLAVKRRLLGGFRKIWKAMPERFFETDERCDEVLQAYDTAIANLSTQKSIS